MAEILVYNIKDEQKLTGIRLCALKQGAETVVVSPEDFSKPLKSDGPIQRECLMVASSPLPAATTSPRLGMA